MIRGPVLPHVRESLWALIASRLATLEQGLTLVAEGLDCGGGQLGLCEGLARDALGAPVLVLLAVDGDPLLPARTVAACEFLARVGDALVAAVPEGQFCGGVAGRVVVVGTDAAAASLETLRRLPFPALAVCRLEPFRLGSSERFAVRWLSAAVPAEAAPVASPGAVDLMVPPTARAEWEALRSLCERIDPAVQIDGDRYRRRITWRGRLLGEVVTAEGQLRGSVADGAPRALDGVADVRSFAEQLIRRFATVAGLGKAAVAEPVVEPPRAPRPARAEVVEGLRAAAASTRLSAEEYEALGGPVRGTAAGAEDSHLAAGTPSPGFEGSWTAPRPD